MNYSHAFHAGSFADVFKHVVLCTVLEHLIKKEKPFCFIDTHAGEGKYNLRALESQKTKEYEFGINRVVLDQDTPPIIQTYLTIVKNQNKAFLQYYPGSPLIAHHYLRHNDRLILSELQPEKARALKLLFKNDPQVGVHYLNGYQALKAFLPPKPPRGLVLIDPPYEDKNEFDLLASSLRQAYRRWSQGIYLVWYPIKQRHLINQFERQLLKIGPDHLLMTELSVFPDDSPFKLNGSGMAILNPPWQLKETLKRVLPWLLNALDSEKRGKFRVESLTPFEPRD